MVDVLLIFRGCLFPTTIYCVSLCVFSHMYLLGCPILLEPLRLFQHIYYKDSLFCVPLCRPGMTNYATAWDLNNLQLDNIIIFPTWNSFCFLSNSQWIQPLYIYRTPETPQPKCYGVSWECVQLLFHLLWFYLCFLLSYHLSFLPLATAWNYNCLFTYSWSPLCFLPQDLLIFTIYSGRIFP